MRNAREIVVTVGYIYRVWQKIWRAKQTYPIRDKCYPKTRRLIEAWLELRTSENTAIFNRLLPTSNDNYSPRRVPKESNGSALRWFYHGKYATSFLNIKSLSKGFSFRQHRLCAQSMGERAVPTSKLASRSTNGALKPWRTSLYIQA
jgi:hypothetical protein